MKPMVYIGSDHAGFERKNEVREWLKQAGYTVEDMGTYSSDSADYPIYGQKVGEAVVAHEHALGVVVCGSGIGISIAANKVPGVRCVLCTTPEIVVNAREHGGINVLAIAGRGQALPPVGDLLTPFFETDMDTAERHQRRRDQLDAMAC